MSFCEKQLNILKRINQTTEDIVYGYIHESEKTFKLWSPIPTPMIQIVLLFYYLYDKWDAMCKGRSIVIHGESNIIENINSDWQSIFGENICEEPYSYSWSLKIVGGCYSVHGCWENLVGIHVNDGDEMTDAYFTASKTGYAFIGSQASLTQYGYWKTVNEYGQKFEKIGDTMRVYLDLKKHTLSYCINGQFYGTAFDVKPNTEYKFAVSLQT
eukprot:90464_1